jgi:hypothetical protein
VHTRNYAITPPKMDESNFNHFRFFGRRDRLDRERIEGGGWGGGGRPSVASEGRALSTENDSLYIYIYTYFFSIFIFDFLGQRQVRKVNFLRAFILGNESTIFEI